MTRWLLAAKQGIGPSDKTDTTDKTPEGQAAPSAPHPPGQVLSVKSVLSEGEQAVSGGGDTGDSLDHFEERAAIREHDGGQARAEAEAAALIEAAQAAGLPPEALRRLWAEHPDAATLLDLLRRSGPLSYGAAGSTLGWGMGRAWQAEARLRAAGLVRHDRLGRAVPAK